MGVRARGGAIGPHASPCVAGEYPHVSPFLVEIAGDSDSFGFFNYPVTKFPDLSRLPRRAVGLAVDYPICVCPLPFDHNDIQTRSTPNLKDLHDSTQWLGWLDRLRVP